MKQVARFIWPVVLALVACSQPSLPDTPEPTEDDISEVTMSTGEDDAAKRIFVDTRGDSYVLGSAGSNVFLNHYRRDGSLVWRVNTGLKNCRACHTLDIRLLDDTLYVLTLEGQRVTLSIFDRSGGRVSSRHLMTSAENVETASLGSVGQSYIVSRSPATTGVAPWRIDVFNSAGELLWSDLLPFAQASTDFSQSGASLALASDDSVYVAGIGDLRKYSASGKMLWSREFTFSNQTHIRENLAVAPDRSVYFVRDLTLGDVVPFNVEVRRLSAEGEDLWSQTLLAETSVSKDRELSAEILTVSPSGSLYLATHGALIDAPEIGYVDYFSYYAVTPAGEVTGGSGTASFGLRVYDMAFAPREENDSNSLEPGGKIGYLFVAGSSSSGEAVGQGIKCDIPEGSAPSPYCPDTDAFLAQYLSLSSDLITGPPSSLVWYRY